MNFVNKKGSVSKQFQLDFIFLYVDEEIHNINKNREKLIKIY